MQYALIKNGEVVNTVVADQSFINSISSEYDHVEPLDTLLEQNLSIGIGWSYSNGTFAAPVLPVQPTPPVVPETRHITQLAFLNRFTDAEAIAIDLASQGATVQAAAMRRYQSKVSAATYIDLDRQDTRDGVLALETAGLLGTGRALIILDDPIQAEEKSK